MSKHFGGFGYLGENDFRMCQQFYQGVNQGDNLRVNQGDRVLTEFSNSIKNLSPVIDLRREGDGFRYQ